MGQTSMVCGLDLAHGPPFEKAWPTFTHGMIVREGKGAPSKGKKERKKRKKQKKKKRKRIERAQKERQKINNVLGTFGSSSASNVTSSGGFAPKQPHQLTPPIFGLPNNLSKLYF